MKTIILVCLLAFGFNAQVYADNFKPVDVNVYGFSHHPGGTHGGKLNEKNYGLGLRYNFNWKGPAGFSPFLEADMLTNSNRGRATILGGGVKNNAIFSLGPLSFGGGAAIVNLGYENPRFHKTAYVWTPAVFLSTTYKDWLTLNMIPVPKQDKGIFLFSLTLKHVW